MSELAPNYPHEPVWSVAALCRALEMPEALLASIASRVPKLYRGPTKKLKKSGKGYRDVYDTNAPLKPLLKKINRVFFTKVAFPEYLHGSIKGCDFVSNARAHEGSKTLITEDIKGFFDHITEEQVYTVWRRFFGFGEAPSQMLTALVTNGGKVFQGAPTSPYVANLVFFDSEPRIVRDLAERGIRYTRFVDDVSLSHRDVMPNDEKSWAIAQIYGMLGSHGFTPARDKHAIFNGSGPRSIMRLNVNKQLTITPEERGRVRAMIHQIGIRVRSGENTYEVRQLLRSAFGKIGRIKRLHSLEAARLLADAKAIQAILDTRPTNLSADLSAQVSLDERIRQDHAYPASLPPPWAN